MIIKIHYYFIMCALYLLAGCSSSALHDFSTPEKAYETLHQALSANDMELYSKCFFKAEDKEIIKDLDIMGGFPKAVKFIKHEVLDKEIINESEVNLKLREVLERKHSSEESPIYIISTYLAKYRKTSDGWKFYSSTEVNVHKARKVGDQYEPID